MLSVAASSRGAYRRRGFRRVLIGPADRRVTGHAGVAVVAEVDRGLGISSALDGAVGSIKSRRRGVSAGGLLLSMASAHMTGADFLVGMDHRRADTPRRRDLIDPTAPSNAEEIPNTRSTSATTATPA